MNKVSLLFITSIIVYDRIRMYINAQVIFNKQDNTRFFVLTKRCQRILNLFLV
jgi:hypothetical protein